MWQWEGEEGKKMPLARIQRQPIVFIEMALN